PASLATSASVKLGPTLPKTRPAASRTSASGLVRGRPIGFIINGGLFTLDSKRMIVYYCRMRKIILGFGMTIDGYIARRDHSIDYLVMDKDVEKIMAKFWSTID